MFKYETLKKRAKMIEKKATLKHIFTSFLGSVSFASNIEYY